MISSENSHGAEQNLLEDVQRESVLSEQIGQEERGRFATFVSRTAARVAIVGAIAGSVLVGQGNDEAEASPEQATIMSCTKSGQEGIQLGSLCITREEVRMSGECTKTDKFIGNTAVTIVTLFLPISRAANVATALGYNGITAYIGDFCD